MEVTAEIAGPVLAAFHYTFAESSSDFYAVLLGSLMEQNFSVNSDNASQTEISRSRILVKNWVLLPIDTILNLETGKLNETALKNRVKSKSGLKFLGVLSFKTYNNTDLSFLDRRIIKGILDSCSYQKPHVYVTAAKEVTSSLSVRHTLSTFLLRYGKDMWTCKIPLAVPNLGSAQKVNYTISGFHQNRIADHVEATALLNICDKDVHSSFLSLNSGLNADMQTLVMPISELEAKKHCLEEEVFQMWREVNNKLSICEDMRIIKSVQGTLISALTHLKAYKEDGEPSNSTMVL